MRLETPGTSGGPGSYIVSLDGTRAPTLFPQTDLRFDFVLLDPHYLYNTGDLKFYRLTPPLQRTPLPATLSDAAGNPRGDYHVIRLR
jgi:hypothetical protein